MLVVLSDTHGVDAPRLSGRTREAVRDAEVVVHAGDLTTEAVLEGFHAEADRFLAVHGNSDTPAVADRLPPARTVEYGGVTFAVTHTRPGGATALSLWGRERGADVVVFGHSHRPTVDASGPVTLVNPGSHADPRGHRPAHAEFEATADGLRGRLWTPDGTVFEEWNVGGGNSGV